MKEIHSNALAFVTRHLIGLRQKFATVYSVIIFLDKYGITLLRPMEFSITLRTIIPGWPTGWPTGWPIVYIEGLKVIISKNIVFIHLRVDFVLANSTDSD